MTYCAPRAPNFGFLDSGCSLYGGYQIDCRQRKQHPEAQNQNFYVTQFNLAQYWQRPYLLPHSLGFPQFLARLYDNRGRPNLAPGYWPQEKEGLITRNRNLLTGMAKDEDTVRLWMVSQQCERKGLWEAHVDLEHDSDSLVENWVVTEDEAGQLTRLFPLTMPSAVLELRYGFETNGQHCLLARCEQGLFLVNPDAVSVASVINAPVIEFSSIPYMKNEIVLLDNKHFIWHGDIESGAQLARIKAPENIELVSASDHPRVVYVANSENVFSQDLREGASTGQLLYSIAEYDDASLVASRHKYNQAFRKPSMQHLKMLHEFPRSILVATSKKFCLLDSRMAGKPLLEFSHSIFCGGDYIYSAPSFLDPLDSTARIFPFYVLSHSVKADVQYFSLYNHPGELWSMLSPVKRILEPRAAARFFREQPNYGIRINRREENRIYGFGPTRSIHVQNGLTRDRCGNERHLLFRVTDDGSLWLEALRVTDDSEQSERAISKAAHDLRVRIEQPQSSSWEEDFVEQELDKSAIVYRNAVGAPDPVLVNENPRFGNVCSPFNFTSADTCPVPNVVERTENPDKEISRLILKCFNT